MSGSASRKDHVFGDLLSHNTHLLDAIALCWSCRDSRSSLRFCRGRSGRRRLGRLWLGRRANSARFNETEDVVLGHATTQTGSFELCDVNAMLLRNLAYERARFSATEIFGCGRAAPVTRGPRVRGLRWCDQALAGSFS